MSTYNVPIPGLVNTVREVEGSYDSVNTRWVLRERTQLVDGGGSSAEIKNTAPTGNEYALLVRPIGGGSTGGTVALSQTGSDNNVDVVSLPTLPAGDNNIGNVDVATLPAITGSVSVSSMPSVDISDRPARDVGIVTSYQGGSWSHGLGVSTGKVNILKTGSLTTTATTADQVILTYTVTSGKIFYVEYLMIQARLTTLSATASILGAASLETPSGTKGFTATFTNPTTSQMQPYILTFVEPIPIAAGVVIRVVCAPAAATPMLWIANFGGYEK